jgi:hypothetical protein
MGLIRSACAAGWVLGLAGWASACSSASNDLKPGDNGGGGNDAAASTEPDGGGASGDGSAGGSGHDAASSQGGDATTGKVDGGADAQPLDAQTKDAPGGDGASKVYPPFAGAGTIDDGIAQLNLYRALVGLPPVTLDPVSSIGCSSHLAYLICAAAAGGGNGYLEHTETGFPACAGDGGQAGIDSDLAWGQARSGGQTTGQSFGQAVDVWINGLYHRTPLLDPGLMRVGAASAMGYNCLDYAATGNRTTVKAVTPVLFPPDGTTDVPLSFEGNEGPCPTAANPLNATTCAGSGFIVSANWYAWSTGNNSAIGGVTSATLTDTQTQTVVPLFAYYADKVTGHDPAPGYVRNEIALVPQANLAAHHTFTVDISATISNQPTNLSWSFTTGTRAP